jgi:hypothetical protein
VESIYWVLSWACHRKCRHCYEDRFRPYVRGALDGVVAEASAAWPRVLRNLPADLTFLDTARPLENALEPFERRPARIIMAGGELLIDQVREAILYPALEAIRDRYGAQGVKVAVQTTGDLVTPKIVDEMLARGVWMISVAGMDDFHVGMEGDKRVPLIDRLRAVFAAAGMRDAAQVGGIADGAVSDGPVYGLFGATEDAWIGKIWPRGRAWENGLSKATLDDNFCNVWSGGLNFLRRGHSGAEVSIDPNGDVFPCCLKTRRPLGNLTEERLEDILDSLQGHPAFEAINAGAPERMGVTYGWDVARFLEESRTLTPQGAPYRNLCVGCDRFHDKVLGPMIDAIRAERMAARQAAQ